MPSLVLAAAVSASAALAQAGASSVTVTQLSAPDRPGAAFAPAQPPPAGALDRKAREALVSSGAPIGEGRRTAEASPDIATRAQGRVLATPAIGGVDRCEAGSPGAGTELCRRRIETRADQYGRAGPAPVTPEARLLILSDPQNQPQSFDAATRRLGASPQVDALAGAAATQLSGVLDAQRSTTSNAAPAASPTATGLPAGVPSTVIISPR